MLHGHEDSGDCHVEEDETLEEEELIVLDACQNDELAPDERTFDALLDA